MAKYTVAVVDDFRDDAEECVRYLSEISDVGDIHLLTNPFEVPRLLKSETIDILFMDIEMPGASGLDIYASIPEAQRPVLVLVTNHDQFALNGFKLNAADYVMKPVDFVSVSVALTKALQRLNVSFTVYNVPERDYSFYPVKGGGMEVLNYVETICVEGDGNYTIAHLRGGAKMVIRKRMYEMAQDLPATLFLRIHQSFMVNWRFAGKLTNEGLYVREFAETDPLPVSRPYRAMLARKLRG